MKTCALCNHSDGDLIWYRTALSVLRMLGTRLGIEVSDSEFAHYRCLKKLEIEL